MASMGERCRLGGSQVRTASQHDEYGHHMYSEQRSRGGQTCSRTECGVLAAQQ
jgi:hypothetical protein